MTPPIVHTVYLVGRE